MKITIYYDYFQRNVARKLREFEWTQQDLADAMGCSRQWVGQLLSGDRNPGMPTLIKIAEALDCKPEELFTKPID